MVKTKQRPQLAGPSGLNGSSNSNFDPDLHGDNSWVIVKIQKVNILVPPLPTAKVIQRSELETSQPEFQTIPTEKANSRSEKPNETSPKMPSPTEDQQNSMVLAYKKGTRLSRKAPPLQHFSTLAKALKQDRRIESVNPDRVGTLKSHNVLHICNASKSIEQSLNQRLRALNLERKLQKAGGISRWLVSLGLAQFVRIFQRKSITKFQLVNMTMKKLKDMGTNAVGPRRKLMHAIDCICQPYCFESV